MDGQDTGLAFGCLITIRKKHRSVGAREKKGPGDPTSHQVGGPKWTKENALPTHRCETSRRADNCPKVCSSMTAPQDNQPFIVLPSPMGARKWWNSAVDGLAPLEERDVDFRALKTLLRTRRRGNSRINIKLCLSSLRAGLLQEHNAIIHPITFHLARVATVTEAMGGDNH